MHGARGRGALSAQSITKEVGKRHQHSQSEGPLRWMKNRVKRGLIGE